MSNHTPGPWYLNNDDETEDGTIDVISKRRPYICTVHSGAIPGTTDANARLIAAAPAMDLALSMISCGVARIERCGRLEEFCFDGLRYCLNGDWNALFDVIGWEKARAAIAKATEDGA